MLKERTELIRTLLYVTDLVIVSVNFFAVYYILLHFKTLYTLDIFPQWKVVRPPGSMDQYLRAFWLGLVIWAGLLRARGEYHHLRIQSYNRVVLNVLTIGFFFFCIFASAAFVLKMEFVSRLWMIAYTGSSAVLLLLNRLVVMSIAYYVRSKGYNYRNLLLVGTGSRAKRFMKLVAKHKEWGYRIIGLLDNDSKIVGQEIEGHPVIGVMDELPKLLEKHVVDEVVFVVPRNWLQEIEKCILYCEAVGVPATLSTDFFDLDIASGVPKEMDGFTYLTFETSQLKASELIIKRSIDLVLSTVALVILSPLFLVIAILMKSGSKGPVFFSQIRCGRNGRLFKVYKFRSMVKGAEAKLEELKAFNEMSGPVFKMTNDPRLTPIGKFLRKTSLDEIPQFWNVLKGDMSLVGPRPPIPKEVEAYEPWQRRRLSMKPGITCIWQVSGRNQINFEDWIRLDLQYIDRWSLWLDLKIVLLTVKAVFTSRGAK